MATKTLGLTGRDYSTLAAWATYVNALSLAANEILEVYNDGGAVADTAAVTVGGWTANGFTVTMRPASGQGIKDHANRLTNALRWDASLGAALTNSASYADAYVLSGTGLALQDLQLRATHATAGCVVRPSSGLTISRCILWKSSGGYAVTQASNVTINDSLLVNGNGSGVQVVGDNVAVDNCTIATVAAGGTGVQQSYTQSIPPRFRNTVFWNFGTDVQGTTSASTTNNATSKASFGGTGWGTSGQTSVTSADFENVSSGTEDFRIAAGSTKLINTGATAVGSGADVVNTTRTGTLDIGAWEFAAGGGGTSSLSPRRAFPLPILNH